LDQRHVSGFVVSHVEGAGGGVEDGYSRWRHFVFVLFPVISDSQRRWKYLLGFLIGLLLRGLSALAMAGEIGTVLIYLRTGSFGLVLVFLM
jgi:hypothetical protein